MLAVPDVTDVDLVFGGGGRLPLPAEKDIPKEFWRSSNPWATIASEMFFRGGKLSDWGLTAKPGVDLAKAMRAIKTCLGSFDPSHEHKEAGVAYMLSEWFDRAAAASAKRTA